MKLLIRQFEIRIPHTQGFFNKKFANFFKKIIFYFICVT